MISVALVSLALLQAAAPQGPMAGLAVRSEGIASILQAYGPVLAPNSAVTESAPISLRFGQTDAWGCLYAASGAGYCRHLGVATDGESLLAVGGVPVVLNAGTSGYGPCGWTLNGGIGNNHCWYPYGLDPAAYTSWLQAQPLTWEEYSMGYKGEIRGRQLAEQRAREGVQQSQPVSMPGIHPDAPRPQTPSSGYSRPDQNSGASRPASGGRPGGRDRN